MTVLDPGVMEQAMTTIMRSYRRTLEPNRRHLLDHYRFVHLARKVVGVGSVGTDAWILLLLDDHGAPLLLQVKQAETSVLEQFTTKSRFSNHGQRVVAGQRLMQAASDIFLGWERFDWGGVHARLLHPPAARLEGLGRHQGHDTGRHGAVGSRCAAGRSPGATPARATASRSPPTSEV